MILSHFGPSQGPPKWPELGFFTTFADLGNRQIANFRDFGPFWASPRAAGGAAGSTATCLVVLRGPEGVHVPACFLALRRRSLLSRPPGPGPCLGGAERLGAEVQLHQQWRPAVFKCLSLLTCWIPGCAELDVNADEIGRSPLVCKVHSAGWYRHRRLHVSL